MNNFYVYCYLDPRKLGKYVYDNFLFSSEPFYVGKGCNEEYLYYLYLARSDRDNKIISYKINKIKKIIREGLQPVIVKIKEDLDEIQAFELEKYLISIIGRFDLMKGPLTNLTDGGEGLINLSDEVREKIRKKTKEGMNKPEVKERMSVKSKEFHNRPEVKKYFSENNPSKRPEVVEKMSAALKGRAPSMLNKHHSVKSKEKMKKAWLRRKSKCVGEKRPHHSERMKELWKDIKYREKVNKSKEITRMMNPHGRKRRLNDC